MSIDDEFATLVREDLHHLAPTVGSVDVLRRGRRSLRRRRAASGVATAAAVAGAVVLPITLAGGDGGTADGSIADVVTPAPTPSVHTQGPDVVLDPGCGWFTCADRRTDSAPLLGNLFPLDTSADGSDEVAWAESRRVDGDGWPVIEVGFDRGDHRTNAQLAFQPGHEPAPCAIHLFQSFYVDSWSFLGYLPGSTTDISFDGGSRGEVHHTSAAVLDGYTVFVAHGDGGPSQRPTSFTAVVDGRRVTADTADCAFAG